MSLYKINCGFNQIYVKNILRNTQISSDGTIHWVFREKCAKDTNTSAALLEFILNSFIEFEVLTHCVIDSLEEHSTNQLRSLLLRSGVLCLIKLLART